MSSRVNKLEFYELISKLRRKRDFLCLHLELFENKLDKIFEFSRLLI
jgi:hypothetical protein